MAINGSAGWEQGLKQGEKDVADRAGRAQDRVRARMAANAGADQDPGEPLVCPQCRRSQPTGLYCPHCDVELVGESFVDVAAPAKRPSGISWIFITVVVLGIGALVVGMSVAIFGG